MAIYYNETSIVETFIDPSQIGFPNGIEYCSTPTYDKAYLINLDISVDRLESSSYQLEGAGIDFIRFPAIDGYKLKIEDLDTGIIVTGQELRETTIKIKKNVDYRIIYDVDPSNIIEFKYSGVPQAAGELGILASNIAVNKDALAKGYERIIIFEDDINILSINEFSDQVSDFISSLPSNFDFGYLDYNQVKGFRIPIEDNEYVSAVSEDFIAWGQWATVISKQGMEKITSYESYHDPIDVFVWLESDYTDDGLITYVSEFNLVTTSGDSTIDPTGRSDDLSGYSYQCYDQ